MLFTFFIVVHDSPYYIIFSNIKLGWQEEVFKMNAISYLSFLYHFNLTIFIFGQNPLYIQLIIWHHFEYFPGRIVIKDAKQEAVLTSCLQNCMPCRICDPCIIISFTGLIFLQKPYTFVIFDNFQQYRGVDRHTGRQIRSSILQVPVEKRAVSYLWSFYRYFHHNLIFRPKSPYWVMILLHPELYWT